MSTMKTNTLSVTFVVIATVTCCLSLRIRRSGIAGYDDPYGLTNALDVMERSQRAGGYDGYLNRRFPSEKGAYFNPNTETGYELSPADYLSAIGYNDADDDDALAEYEYGRAAISPAYRRLEKIPLMFNDNDMMSGYGPQKRTAYNHRRVVPTIDELRTLFGEADVPMKRLAPVKRRQPDFNRVSNNEIEAVTKQKKSSNSDKAQLSKQWEDLINAAEKLTRKNVEDNAYDGDKAINNNVSDDTGTNTDNTIQDELNDAFSDAEVGDDSETGDVNDESDDEIIKDNDDQPQTKSKRASSGVGDTSDYIVALLKDISELKEKVSVLEMKQLLEDRENDFLANALKYSTMDQMGENNDFVKDEYSNIAKATKIEELLEEFSDATEDEDDYASESEDGPISYDTVNQQDIIDEVADKRSEDPIPDEIEGEWLEAPIQESVKGGGYLKDDDDDDDEFLEPMSTVSSFVDDDIDDVTNNDVMENAVAEALSERQEEEAEDDKELLLARLISNLSPVAVQEILTELQEQPSGTDSSSNEMCPAVSELSQDCAFADERNIPMDDEARNLCIRHQLCYLCGEALGISAGRCDGGYKGTVIAECNGDVTCVRSAAYFLQLMTSRYHVYATYSPDQCLNSCVKDFIYGVA